MSGSKRVTVTISEEEYQRLREAERKLRTMPKPKSEAQVALEQRSLQQIQANMQQSHQRQAVFQEMLLGMNGTIQHIEENTSRAMQDFQERTLDELQDHVGSLTRYVDKRLADQTRRFEAAIKANHKAYQQEIGQISREMRRIASDQQRKREIAEEWLNAGEAVLIFLGQNYACDFFLPGKVARLEQQLLQARYNLENGLSEAAIAPAQQIYMALSDMRVELEQLEQEWRVLYQAAGEKVDQLQLLIEESRFVQALDLDGVELPYEVDVEFWSEGRWSEICRQLEIFHNRLVSEENLPDAETLDHWLAVDLPAIERAMEDTVLDTRVSALNSQLRINIADLVVQALREQGFSTVQSQYDENDQRSCYSVQLNSIDGGEVLVQVAPSGTAVGENKLQIDSFDREERTEHELHQRWMEISRSLAGYGISVGGYERLEVPRSQPSRGRRPLDQRPPLRQPGRTTQPNLRGTHQR